MRYKGGEPPLMICTALRAAMICQACGLDKKIPVPQNEDFLVETTGLELSYAIPLTRYRVKTLCVFTVTASVNPDCHNKRKKHREGAFFFYGGNNWTRTSDPLHVKQVL